MRTDDAVVHEEMSSPQKTLPHFLKYLLIFLGSVVAATLIFIFSNYPTELSYFLGFFSFFVLWFIPHVQLPLRLKQKEIYLVQGTDSSSCFSEIIRKANMFLLQ
jgi:hypothetical protein